MNSSKNILLIYKNQTLSKVFEENLRREGYQVEPFFKEIFIYYQLNFFQKILNIICRSIFKYNNYPLKANQSNFKKLCKNSLKKLEKKHYDFCLVIRGDLIPEFVFSSIRKNCDRVVDFQLDGLSVSSQILDYKKYMDEIFVFDPEDVEKYPDYNLKFLPNCYFGEIDYSNPVEIDLLYIGQYIEKRHQQLYYLHQYLESQNFPYTSYTSLYQGRDFKSLHTNILHHKTPTTYQENINFVKKSKILIDFKREEHNGLSLRFFEAIQFGKKIITNNTSTINYDFYHKNNIFVTDFINLDGLTDFLQKPYYSLPIKIIEKYSFKNWLNTILSTQKNKNDS